LQEIAIFPIQNGNSDINHEMNNKIKIIKNIQIESMALNIKNVFDFSSKCNYCINIISKI